MNLHNNAYVSRTGQLSEYFYKITNTTDNWLDMGVTIVKLNDYTHQFDEIIIMSNVDN